MGNQSRDPRGIPTGGRFAPQSHTEVDIVLDDHPRVLDEDDLAEFGFDDMRFDMEYRHRPEAAEPEPEPEPEPAGPVFGRAPGASAPVDIIDWPTNQKALVTELKSTLEAVGELHGVRDNGFGQIELVLGSNKNGGKGGHWSPSRPPGPKPRRKRGESYFDYRQRTNDWYNAPRRPEIRVNSRGNEGEESFNLLHELGHRMDCEPQSTQAIADDGWSLGRKSQYHSEVGYQSLNPEAAAAFQEFAEAARETPNIKDAFTNFRGRGGVTFATYHRDIKEVWARAYAQWATNKIGGPAAKALAASQERGAYQWPDDEFESLAPLVENVLRKTGAMRDH